MSRTDVHRPWRVQENDPYDRIHWYRRWCGDPHVQRYDYDQATRRWTRYEPIACDLHDGRDQRGPRTAYRCFRTPTRNLCGCQLCTGSTYRHAARRAERRYWSAALAQPSIDFDDADVMPFSPRW